MFEEISDEEEIKRVVWFCDFYKVPGYDGYNMGFIKNMWDTIGADFTDMVKKFFVYGRFSNEVNMIWVIMIQKFEGAQELNVFRLISMIGCIYKVILKVFTERFKGFMLFIVGEFQSVYVSGR